MMTFRKFAFNNIRRNPVRAVLTALSVLVSAATLTVVLSLDKGYTSAVKNELVDKTGVHMYITKEGCPIEAASVIAQGGLSPLYVEENVTGKVLNVPQVETVLPFKLFAVTTDDGTRTDIFMGVTESIRKMKPDWVLERGEWFPHDSAVILGAEMGRVEMVDVGQRIYSEHFDREFVVSGILKRNYSQDDGTFFLPLKTAQTMIRREDKLSAIAIKLKDIETLEDVKTELRSMLPQDHFVISSKELGEGILEFFTSTRVIMFVMVAVAFVVSVFGIINTMIMTVMERRKEIAYLKCTGAGKTDIVKLIALETVTICILGSALGVLFGTVLSPTFGNFMRQFMIAYAPSGSIGKADPLIILGSFAVCIVTGLICSVYPALRAARIVPMEVLRNE
ncbi:MAG: ABC transporter permease [Chitinispirillaceae bacterium]